MHEGPNSRPNVTFFLFCSDFSHFCTSLKQSFPEFGVFFLGGGGWGEEGPGEGTPIIISWGCAGGTLRTLTGGEGGGEGWQGWCSGESMFLPQMLPRFDSHGVYTVSHMWVQFIIGSHPSEGFSPGSSVFLHPRKPTLPNSNSTWNGAPLNKLPELFDAPWANKRHNLPFCFRTIHVLFAFIHEGYCWLILFSFERLY